MTMGRVMVVTVEWVGAAVALVGFAGCAATIRGLSREVRSWRSSACGLASVVRGLDAWPLGSQEPGEGPLVVVTVPVPVSVAVIGRDPALERWSTQANRALAAVDALCEPYGGER